MQPRLWCVARGLILGGWLVGCESPSRQPPRDPRGTLDHDSVPRRSLEWVTVTERARGDRERECERARSYVLGEANCSSTSCLHAVRLTRDWAALCRARARGSRAAELERLSIEVERRTKVPPDGCVRQIEAWLGQSSGNRHRCDGALRAAAARCALSAPSPLARLMVERSLEPGSSPADCVMPDPRSCVDLAHELVRDSTCSQPFACEDSLPKVERYRRSCRPSGSGLREALAELAIRQGAAEPAPAVSVAPGATGLDREDELALARGGGVALRVCGKRVFRLEEYLSERSQCLDGKVVFAFLFGQGDARELRAGTFEHPSDAVFARRLPSLWVTGERERRERALLETLDDMLGPIAAREPGPAAIDELVRALGTLDPQLMSKTIIRALGDWDARFEPHLLELGRLKQGVRVGLLPPRDRWAFEARAWSLPLADLAPGATVLVGFPGPAAALELEQILPRSIASYRARILGLAKDLDKSRHAAPDTRWLTGEFEGRSEACQSALAAAKGAEDALVACALGSKTCNAEEHHAMGRALDVAQQDLQKARTSMVMSLHGLLAAEPDGARALSLAEQACPKR